MRILFAAMLCAAALVVPEAIAQDVAPPFPADAPASAPCCNLPAGTPIALEIRDALDSKLSQRGDKFAIALRTPLYVGERLVIPAGTPGVGEVVHAERARGGGKPGELILAARYLELAGRRIPLRGMKLGATGVDKSGKAIALGSIPIVGLFTYVRGGETHVPQGAFADAKIAEALVLDASAATPTPASEPAPAPAPAQDAPVVSSSIHAVSKE